MFASEISEVKSFNFSLKHDLIKKILYETGSVLAYETDAKGVITKQESFCITIGSPDVRTGAKCLDAHTTACIFLDTAKAAAWIKNIIAGKYDIQRNPAPERKIVH